MILHICLRTPAFARAVEFYDLVLSPLGYSRVSAGPRSAGYGEGVTAGFWLVDSGETGQNPPGPVSIGFSARSERAVETFHVTAVRAGAVSIRAPGPAPSLGVAAIDCAVRDLDGMLVEAVFRPSTDTNRVSKGRYGDPHDGEAPDYPSQDQAPHDF